MNELVKALIEKAREEVKSRQKFGSDPLHLDLFSADDFHRRIAELIVEECANLTKWQDCEMSAEKRIRLEIYHAIKDEFAD